MANTIKPHRRPGVSGSRTAAKAIRDRGNPSPRQRKLGGVKAMHPTSDHSSTTQQNNSVRSTSRRQSNSPRIHEKTTQRIPRRHDRAIPRHDSTTVHPRTPHTTARRHSKPVRDKTQQFSAAKAVNCVGPDAVKGGVLWANRRNREHLTPDEVDRLLKAARRNRHGCRDYVLVLVSYTHGLRISEAIAARWQDFDLKVGVFHVHRLKGSMSGDHPLRGVEIRALRQLNREGPASGDFLFVSERGGRLSVRGVQKMIERLAGRAGLGGLKVHPHMLRHACGYYLADQGVDLRVIQQYLGHKHIRHTVRYTALSPRKFRRLWDD